MIAVAWMLYIWKSEMDYGKCKVLLKNEVEHDPAIKIGKVDREAAWQHLDIVFETKDKEEVPNN